MGDAVGPARILAVLEAMHDFYKEPRYRPSVITAQRLAGGVVGGLSTSFAVVLGARVAEAKTSPKR